MPQITSGETLERIAAGELAPVYLVLGDDDEEMAEVAAAFEEIVEEGLRPFNVEHLDGVDDGLLTVVEATRTLPMMAPRRLVILNRAALALLPKRETTETAAGLEAFEAYLADPAPHATLVLVAGDLHKGRRITKRLLDRATVVTCGVVESLADAERWVRRRVEAGGMTIEPRAVRELAVGAGPDVSRLRGDVDRVLLYAAGQPTVGVEDVRATAGPAAAHDDWAVARAIERGQAALALRELALVLDGGAIPYKVLGQLAWVARAKLRPERVPAAIEAVFSTDLAIKRSAGDHRVLLERLVLALCGVS